MFSKTKQLKAKTILFFVLLALIALFAYCLKANLEVDYQLSRFEKLLSDRELARNSVKYFIVTATAPYSTVEMHIRGGDTIFVELNVLQGDKNQRVRKLIEQATSIGISPVWCPDCSPKIFGISLPTQMTGTLLMFVLALAGMLMTPKFVSYWLKNPSP